MIIKQFICNVGWVRQFIKHLACETKSENITNKFYKFKNAKLYLQTIGLKNLVSSPPNFINKCGVKMNLCVY